MIQMITELQVDLYNSVFCITEPNGVLLDECVEASINLPLLVS